MYLPIYIIINRNISQLVSELVICLRKKDAVFADIIILQKKIYFLNKFCNSNKYV